MDESRWYVALPHAAVGRACTEAPKGSNGTLLCCTAAAGWACSAGPDEMITWYVALLYAAVGWVCADALDENPWYVADENP